ncbi:MAG: hypothetical protein ABSC76_15090 [Terracidiphilus sp.]|jgi:hypothetical protein
MRAALIMHRLNRLTIRAQGEPPRDRTTRACKACQVCEQAWRDAYDTATAKGLNASKALRMASVGYKLAMPKMDTMPAIRAAIACIAQGIQLEVFDGRDGSQLLYAAQVAMSTLNGGKRK